MRKTLDCRGRTVVELLLVLGVSGILAGAAYSTINQTKDQLAMQQAIRELRSNIRWAQQLAIENGRQVELELQGREIRLVEGWQLLQRLPKSVQIIQARFGRLSTKHWRFAARANGSVTPGRIVLGGADKRNCTLTVGLRGSLNSDCL